VTDVPLSQPTLTPLRVNGERLLQSLQDLGQIGRQPNGGIQRLAFSPEDIAGRQLVQTWMQAAGMGVRIDAAGNLIGCYPGQNPQAPVLATGSHLDTVPNGGIYDGAYGVLAGLEVVRVLQEKQIQLQHSLEVIVFTDEEGTMVGSKTMVGEVSLPSDDSQIPLALLGGSWPQIAHAQRSSKDIAAFVELHVEQGPVLEAIGAEIGVVTGVVGQRRWMITVQGQASHAGTTPMSMRQDALVASAQIVLAVNQLANLPGEQVATVGQLQVLPNAVNVIPGQVELSLDIRDLSNAHLDHLLSQLDQQIQQIAHQTQTTIQVQEKMRNQPAPAAPEIQRAITAACHDLGLSHHALPSRAGHDAQAIAKIAPMGMIFVPSQAGISHAETEYTSAQHCIQGANVLLQTLVRLDQDLPENHDLL
jgi:beta-ureidopropionase / N-carbamoyl-L-amino-acid hydrolase